MPASGADLPEDFAHPEKCAQHRAGIRVFAASHLPARDLRVESVEQRAEEGGSKARIVRSDQSPQLFQAAGERPEDGVSLGGLSREDQRRRIEQCLQGGHGLRRRHARRDSELAIEPLRRFPAPPHRDSVRRRKTGSWRISRQRLPPRRPFRRRSWRFVPVHRGREHPAGAPEPAARIAVLPRPLSQR